MNDASGRQLWKGTVNGTAKRFGRSLNPENYQEVFSDAMVNLVEGLLNNAGFRAALKRDAKPAGEVTPKARDREWRTGDSVEGAPAILHPLSSILVSIAIPPGNAWSARPTAPSLGRRR